MCGRAQQSVPLSPLLGSIPVTGMGGAEPVDCTGAAATAIAAHPLSTGHPCFDHAAAGSLYRARVQGAQSARACGGSPEAHLRLPGDLLLTVPGEECLAPPVQWVRLRKRHC